MKYLILTTIIFSSNSFAVLKAKNASSIIGVTQKNCTTDKDCAADQCCEGEGQCKAKTGDFCGDNISARKEKMLKLSN